jgi:hypothetical protein
MPPHTLTVPTRDGANPAIAPERLATSFGSVPFASTLLTEVTPQKQLVTRGQLRRWMLQFALVGLVLFGLAEVGARALVAAIHPPMSHATQFDLKYLMATDKRYQQSPTMVVLGNSYMNRALYPDWFRYQLLQAKRPLGVINLANSAATPKVNAYLLKAFLEKGHNSAAAVILNVHPRMFLSDTRQTSGRITPLPDSVETRLQASYLGRCELNPSSDWASHLTCAAESASYLLRYRGWLKEVLGQSQAIFKPIQRPSPGVSRIARNELPPHGWAPGYDVIAPGEFDTTLAELHDQEYRKYRLNPALKQQFEASSDRLAPIVAFCQARHIPLVLVWLPQHPKANQFYGFSRHQLQEAQAVWRQTAQQPGVWYVDLHDRLPGDQYYYDTGHVNVVGAVEVTKLLATAINALPTSTFWHRALREVPKSSDDSSRRHPKSKTTVQADPNVDL